MCVILRGQVTVGGLHKVGIFQKCYVSIFTKNENAQKLFSFSIFKSNFFYIENEN